MKTVRTSVFLVISVFLSIIALSGYAAESSQPELTAVKIVAAENTLKVILSVTRKVAYKDFKLDSTTPRMVIDLYNTKHNWPGKQLASPYAPLLKIRSSQYRLRPQAIVRIVLDLARHVSYTIRQTNEFIEISLPLESSQEFSAGKESAPELHTPEIPLLNPSAVEAVPATSTPVSVVPETDIVQRPQGSITTDLVSLNFERADVRDVLDSLGIKRGINVILEDDVGGEITVNLQNISFKEALNTILKIKNLAMEEISPQVIRITTREKAELTTIFVQLKYAKAEDITNLVSNLLTARGKIQVDKRTNGLLITETTANIDLVMEAIKKVDIKAYVVEIKAEIVEVDTNALRELGINWTAYKGNERASPVATTVNASHTVGTLNLTVGTVMNASQLQATLSILGSKGKSRLLSSPRITTIDNQAAKITIGDRVPYEIKKVSTSAPTGDAGVSTVTESTIEFLDIGIILDVTPTINVDKQVTMKLKPQVSTYTPSDLGPIIHTREAETAVVINDNQTIVIGGLMREDERDITQYVPFIGNIPIVGLFFQKNTKRKDNTELLIFITPKIIE